LSLEWVAEVDPVWDADKQRIIGGAPEGAFVLPFALGDRLPGDDWWTVRDGAPDGPVLGYGRLDTTWGGDAEILLAVDPQHQGSGVGSFLLARLEDEAAARGINYVHNTIREHAQRDLVHDWLVVRGFRGTLDSDLRKRVGSTSAPDRASGSASQPAAQPAPQPASSSQPYDVTADPGALAPGDEEQGGYVDVEDHQY
jgi:GNAT superfamily N-acetyltransferase